MLKDEFPFCYYTTPEYADAYWRGREDMRKEMLEFLNSGAWGQVTTGTMEDGYAER